MNRLPIWARVGAVLLTLAVFAYAGWRLWASRAPGGVVPVVAADTTQAGMRSMTLHNALHVMLSRPMSVVSSVL